MEFQGIYDEFKIKDLERSIEELAFSTDISFWEVVKEVYENGSNGLLVSLMDQIKEAFISEWLEMKNIVITVVIIIVISALFSTFKDMFLNKQIAEFSFYVNYLVLIMIFTSYFGQALEIGESTLKSIEQFMRIFFPAYFGMIGTTIGVGTGLGYYQIAVIVIYVVEWVLISFLLPALSTYMMLVMMNGIWEEGKLALVLDFYRKGIKFTLKILFGMLTGASILQSLITPVMDKVKGEAVYKTIESIPGIGEMTEGALRIWLGSAVLIKNSVGIAGGIFLLTVCLSPMVKIFFMGGILKITSAILSVVAEKKMIICINQVGEAIFMILHTVSYGLLFFVVLIAVTAYATNGVF